MRGVYLRKLNLFTIRQIASKVNTAFLSLWAVCVLLFFSITVFSSGMGLVEVFVGGAERANPYSASLDAAVWYGPGGSEASSSGDPLERRAGMEAEAPDRLAQAESYNWDMAAALEEASPELWAETVGAWAQVSTYAAPDMTYDPLVAAAEATGADPEAPGRSGLRAHDAPDRCVAVRLQRRPRAAGPRARDPRGGHLRFGEQYGNRGALGPCRAGRRPHRDHRRQRVRTGRPSV